MSAENFRDRLRRLRREADPATGGETLEPEPGSSALPPACERAAPSLATESSEGVRTRLARRADRIGRAAELAAEPPSCADDIAYARTSGPPVNLARSGFAHSTVHARTTTFSIEHRHGSGRLVEVASADPRAFELLTGDRALGAFDPLRSIYFDTETTGLNGGAGTYVFLVGLGYFDGDRFHVWQGFLRDPSGERALLAETAERIRAVPGVVSFFGKAFDRHRLEDKMRLHRVEPPFAGRAHLDLYHPLRRLYRRAFDDTRLRTFESRLCGLVRKNDLPGAFAPAAWFDFLAGRPHRLEAVFLHNEDDVLSLVSLAAHLGSTLRGTCGERELAETHVVARAEAIARSFAGEGKPVEALEWIERALTALADPCSHQGRVLRLFRIELLRKTGVPLAALAEAEALTEESEDELSAIAWYELARLCVKPLGDFDRAGEACRRSRAVFESRYTGVLHVRWSIACKKLEERIAIRARASRK